MTILQSVWLIWELYGKKGLPDIDRIQSFGLLAVKIGQIHALRLDFLPPEKCQHLSKLYRKNNPISQEDVDELIRMQGGEALLARIASIEDRPLATASVGQVYKARLDTGESVALKVIKAVFKKRFVRDVENLRRFFAIALTLYPKLKSVGNPIGILDDIKTYTLAELDLRHEVEGSSILRRIAEEYQETFDLSMLRFPKHYEELSGENILTSEFIDAPSVDELLSLGAFQYEDMLKLFYVQGFYIFIAGRFHGDIHPGNVLYDGKQFSFVDTAFVGEVGDRIRRGLFFFFDALSDYDYPECARWLNEMAETRIDGSAFETFRSAFRELYEGYTGSTVSQVSLTRQMMMTIKLGVNSGMKFEKGIFSIIRSLMYLDGMVLRCNPDAILVEDMQRYIKVYKEYV